MTRKIPAPVGNFSTLYDLMLTYDEHSGAGNNGWPQLNSRGPLEEQNRQYVGYMKSAKAEADLLLKQGVGILAQPSRFDSVPPATSVNTHAVTVYNGLSWTRNDVVRIASPSEVTKITAIRDLANKAAVKFDTDENGHAIFVARNVPAFGYSTYEVTATSGRPVSTLVSTAGRAARNTDFSVEVRPDGNIRSIKDLKANREIVSEKGELPFNDLLRVEGSDASKVLYPLRPQISVKKGVQMTQIVVRRERSVFPLTTITIYDGMDRVELHNELDPAQMLFVGGNGNWNDSYYFAFPFNLSANNLKVMRGGHKWFDKLPDDYLPDARRDAVTTQHLIGMTDGTGSALLAHRQAFHWVYPSYVSTKVRPRDEPKGLPAMFTGKFPLPEATIYSRAFRSSNQADTHDKGVINMATVEPGLGGNYIYDYAIAADRVFVPVTAWRLGSAFNLPLRAEYVTVPPVQLSKSFFSVDQPNVDIVTVKPLSDTVIRGEVSAAPLDPQSNKVFVIRLQEFAGKAATVKVTLPVRIKSASLVTLTEDKVLQSLSQIAPLTVAMKPYQTATVKFEIE